MEMNIKEIAKMIDHSLLHPTMTDEELLKGLEVAKKYGVATACVKPYYTKTAAEYLKDSDVLVCAVIGFPHGNSSIEIKVLETVKCCKDGAKEIDMVVNIGKVLGNDWEYVKNELKSINEATIKNGAILKVIFENDYLSEDFHKIKLCEICTELNIAFVKTSSGYGFIKDETGNYNYKGATENDLKLMRKHSGPNVQIKAAGGVRSLDDLLKVRKWGVTRIGATATIAIIEEAKKQNGQDFIDTKTNDSLY